jgi:hypothetical protein
LNRCCTITGLSHLMLQMRALRANTAPPPACRAASQRDDAQPANGNNDDGPRLCALRQTNAKLARPSPNILLRLFSWYGPQHDRRLELLSCEQKQLSAQVRLPLIRTWHSRCQTYAKAHLLVLRRRNRLLGTCCGCLPQQSPAEVQPLMRTERGRCQHLAQALLLPWRQRSCLPVLPAAAWQQQLPAEVHAHRARPLPNILLRLFSWYGRSVTAGLSSARRSGLTTSARKSYSSSMGKLSLPGKHRFLTSSTCQQQWKGAKAISSRVRRCRRLRPTRSPSMGC